MPSPGAVRSSLTCSNCWGRTQIGSCKPRSYSERANRAIGRSISNNLISFSRMADTCARILAELIFLPWCRRALTSTHYNKEERVRSFLVLILIGTLGFLVGCGSSGTPAGVVTSITLTPSSASLDAGQSREYYCQCCQRLQRQRCKLVPDWRWYLEQPNQYGRDVYCAEPSEQYPLPTVVATSIRQFYSHCIDASYYSPAGTRGERRANLGQRRAID